IFFYWLVFLKLAFFAVYDRLVLFPLFQQERRAAHRAFPVHGLVPHHEFAVGVIRAPVKLPVFFECAFYYVACAAVRALDSRGYDYLPCVLAGRIIRAGYEFAEWPLLYDQRRAVIRA